MNQTYLQPNKPRTQTLARWSSIYYQKMLVSIIFENYLHMKLGVRTLKHRSAPCKDCFLRHLFHTLNDTMF